MKRMNKAYIICMSLLACGAFCGGVATMQYAAADGPSVVIEGASVRMSTPTAIRFETTVEKMEGYTYGTLIMPKSAFSGALTVDTANVLNAVANTWQTETLYTVALGGANGENGITNFPKAKYNEPLVARSYAVKDGVYTYSAPVERTLAWVASMALADTGEDKITSTTHREFLEGICDYVVGSDGFAFAEENVIVVDTLDLTTLYSETNGAEGLTAIWSSSAEEIAAVNANGVVTLVGEGTATITAKIGTKTASVNVSAGTVTNATDGECTVELYDENGAYIGAYATTLKDGAYSIVVKNDVNATSAIVSQGEKAAFIDDLANNSGEMISAKYRVGNATLNGKTINSTDNTYATAKASVSGTWAYTTAYTTTYGLIMPATATSGNYSFTTQMTKPSNAQNEAGVGITNGEWVLSFQRATGTGGFPYGTRINVHFEKLGTTTSYDCILDCGYWNGNAGFYDKAYLGGRSEYGNWNNERNDVCGNTASGVYGNAIWTVERTGDSVQLYAEPTTTGTGLERKLVLTVTAEGITLADSAWASDSYNRLFKKDYGTFESSSNATIVEGLSAFFGEGVEHAMAFVSDSRVATSHAVTYKTSMITNKTESWTYNSTANKGETQVISDYAPTGDYSVEFNISGSSTRGSSGNAGIDILKADGKGYVRLIFGTDCNNGNGAYLLISDGSTETKTGIILQKDGADYSVGRFNSSSMSVNVKIVRQNGVITISARRDGASYSYVELLKIDANGISACDNGCTYLNQSKAALDVASTFSSKASALAAYTTGANTFRLFHYSSNAYTYNCTMTVNV